CSRRRSRSCPGSLPRCGRSSRAPADCWRWPGRGRWRSGSRAAGRGAWEERVAGRGAGFAAAATMALSPWWLFNTALGNSEGLLAAAVVWAVVVHLEGRRRAAVIRGAAAALLRPEVWPFLGLYGLWLWRRDRGARGVLAAC